MTIQPCRDVITSSGSGMSVVCWMESLQRLDGAECRRGLNEGMTLLILSGFITAKRLIKIIFIERFQRLKALNKFEKNMQRVNAHAQIDGIKIH